MPSTPRDAIELPAENARAWLQAAVTDFSCDAMPCLPNDEMADLSFSLDDIQRLSTMPLSAVENNQFVDYVPRLSAGRAKVEETLPYDLTKHEQVQLCELHNMECVVRDYAC